MLKIVFEVYATSRDYEIYVNFLVNLLVTFISKVKLRW